MTYRFYKKEIDKLIKLIRKYGKSKEMLHFDTAFEYARNMVEDNNYEYPIDYRLFELIYNSICFGAKNETIYHILKLLNIWVVEE